MQSSSNKDLENPLVTYALRPPGRRHAKSNNQKPRVESGNWFTNCCPICTIEFYAEFFQVTNKDIGQRICMALFPFTTRFADITKTNPDLYGPLWIYTTLILTLAVAGNFARYIDALKQNQSFSYDFDFIPAATTIVYGFGLFVPIAMTIIMKVLGSEIRYVQTICVYGYSVAILVPTSLLCIYPNDMIQLLALIYGMAVSTLFLLMNFHRELGNYIPKSRYIVLAFVGGCQVILLLVFKFKFFSNIYG